MENIVKRLSRFSLLISLLFFFSSCSSSEFKIVSEVKPENVYLAGHVKVGVVLCHGRGKHPRWKVVDPLRKAINQQLGYHTVSIQMPVAHVDWEDYLYLFPESYNRINTAIAFLKNKGINKIYLMGHSMGSRMASAYLVRNPGAEIAGFIGVGIRGYGEGLLDSNENLRAVTIPVVDIYGDGKDSVHAEERVDLVGVNYQQVLIPGADHRFTNRNDEKEMVRAVVEWLEHHSREIGR